MNKTTLFNLRGYEYFNNFDKILYSDNKIFERYKYNFKNDIYENASNKFLKNNLI